VNPYDVLQVDRDAGLAQVKAQYRALSKIYHPDKDGGDKAKFEEIKEAFDILSDPERRKRYDETGKTDPNPVTPEAIRSVMDGMIQNVIDSEVTAADHPFSAGESNVDWQDIKLKIVVSMKTSRRQVVADIKATEKKLRIAKKLASRFKSLQEQDPIAEIFKGKIENIEGLLRQQQNALELSLAVQEEFEKYEYEVGADSEGQFKPTPTLRLGGSDFGAIS